MAYADQDLARHDQLKTYRMPEEGAWRKIAKIIRPDDASIGEGTTTTNERNDAEVFDSTPLYALDSFAGGMFAQATNPINRWFELTLADKTLARWGPVKSWLWTAADVIYASLSPAVSSFYAQAPAWFADLGAFGWGVLSQQERTGKSRIADRSAPIGQIYIDVDEEGETDTVHNAFTWTGRQMRMFFGPQTPPAVRDETDYPLVHAVGPNPEARPDKLGWKYMAFRSCYLAPDFRDLRVEGGFPELPYHMLAWNRRGGRRYPRGIGHNVRPDMGTLNEMERSHLVAGQFAAEPPILLRDEEILSAADVVPNALLYGGVNQRGEALVQVLERKQQVQLSLAQSQQKREAIKTAFLFGVMQLMSRPQMTATEFTGFQVEILRTMAPNLVQVHGGLSHFLARRFRILAEAKQMPPPPQELINQTLDVEYVSPLAKVQKLDEGRAVMAYHEGIERFALTDPNVRDNFDADEAARVYGSSLFIPPAVVRDPKAVAARRQQRAGEQQQAEQIDQAGKVVSIAAEASHAMQAATLADKRGGAGRAAAA